VGGVGAGTGIRASSGTSAVVHGALAVFAVALRDVLLDRALGVEVLYPGIAVGIVGTGIGAGAGGAAGAGGGAGGPGGPDGWEPGLRIIALGSFFLSLVFFRWIEPAPGGGGGPPPPEYCTTSIGLFGGIMCITGAGGARRTCS
jgi:hypothetical protein